MANTWLAGNDHGHHITHSSVLGRTPNSHQPEPPRVWASVCGICSSSPTYYYQSYHELRCGTIYDRDANHTWFVHCKLECTVRTKDIKMSGPIVCWKTMNIDVPVYVLLLLRKIIIHHSSKYVNYYDTSIFFQITFFENKNIAEALAKIDYPVIYDGNVFMFNNCHCIILM